MTYLFLDTNVLLHYRRVEEIDWRSLSKASQVVLVLCPAVIALSNGNRLAGQCVKASEVVIFAVSPASFELNSKTVLLDLDSRHNSRWSFSLSLHSLNTPISLAHTVPRSDSVISVTPEDRAKAVAERFAAELPSGSVPELERIVSGAPWDSNPLDPAQNDQNYAGKDDADGL